MFVCSNCEQLFTEYESYTEYIDGDTAIYQKCSPCCGCDFTEPLTCDCCCQYIVGEYIEVDNGKVYCIDCCVTKNIFD